MSSNPHLIHQNLLFTSEYLVKCFRSWNSSVTQKLFVRFNRRPVTDIWQHWVYFREIVSNHDLIVRNGHQDDRPKDMRALEEYFDLLACWCLGQILDDVRFKDTVMSKILKKLEKGEDQALFLACMEEAVVRDIYSLTTSASPIRSLLVDALIKYGTVGDIQHLIVSTGYPRHFVNSVLLQSFEEMRRFRTVASASSATTTVEGKEAKKTTSLCASSVSDGIGKVDPFASECAYHEHTTKGWPCWRESKWG